MAKTWDVVVIGAGAAGLLAATRAAERGKKVLLVEKNRRPGVKILMSGGTRCNITQAVDTRGIIEAFGPQGRFLHSALATLSPEQLVALFHSEGVPTKVESTGKVFPVSDQAADVLAALLGRLERSGAEMGLSEGVVNLATRPDGSFEISTQRRKLVAPKVVLTSGGQSYPGCGTTGDGYAWAQSMGHAIVTPRPALVPVTTRADWAKSLRGVTLPDVRIQLQQTEPDSPSKRRESDWPQQCRGSLLFAHFGLTGPAVLDISRRITLHPRPRSLQLLCDFIPALNAEKLTGLLQGLAKTDGKKQVVSLLAHWLPRSLSDALATGAGLPEGLRAAELSRAQRARLVESIKRTSFPVTGTMGFKKAEVTAGGVALDEIDPRTMQSKLVSNLFAAGELLDLDGPIGGYNFQAAFSTGWLAGQNV